jgi:hypothetical protein
MKFGLDEKFEFKKSFKLYRKSSQKFNPFFMASIKVSKMQQIFNKISSWFNQI